MSKGNAATLERGGVWRPGSRWRVKPGRFLLTNALKRIFLKDYSGRDVAALSVLAFLLGRVVIAGELMPFGLAFFIAVTRKVRAFAIMAGACSLAGAISVGCSAEAAWHGVIMVMYYYLAGKQDKLQHRVHAAAAVVGIGIALIGAVMLFWQFITPYQLLLLGFNIAACVVLTVIFFQAADLFVTDGFRQINEHQAVCLIVILASAIAGIGQIQLFGYTLRNILSSFFIMAMALQGGIGFGVPVAAAIGFVGGFNDSGGAFAVAHYTAAALLGGAFSVAGRFAVVLGYLTGSVITITYFTSLDYMLSLLTESIAGAALFLAIPAGWRQLWRKSICQSDLPFASERAVCAASIKLRQLSDLFNDLAAAIGMGQAGADELVNDIRQEVDNLGRRVCSTCSSRQYCWEEQFYITYQAFLDLLALPVQAKFNVRSLPKPLRQSCQRQQELLSTAAELAEHKRGQLFWQKKVIEFRALLSEQMRSAGSIVATLADEVQSVPQQNMQATNKLIQAFKQGKCPVDSVNVTGEGRELRITCCKLPCSAEQDCLHKLLPLAETTLGTRLRLKHQCGSKSLRRKCRITLTNAPRFTITVGAASLAKGLDGVSGDTCLVAEAGQGRVAAMICDGMGSGEAAARESRAAVRFLEELLAAEFSLAAAVKTVNAMLLLRTASDCFTTIDATVFDLCSGEVDFLKTGSAASYIKRVREVTVIKSRALPVGIVEHLEVEPQRCKLAAGDIVVMLSDGVAEADRQRQRREWVANYLRLAVDDDPQRLADQLIAQAQKLAGNIRDDMTVLVIKIHERLGRL